MSTWLAELSKACAPLTAFQDGEAAAFRKTFSRIAPDSDIWFSTEPDLIVELRSAKPKR